MAEVPEEVEDVVLGVPEWVWVLWIGLGGLFFEGVHAQCVVLALQVLVEVDVVTSCARAGVGSAPSPWSSVGMRPGGDQKCFTGCLWGSFPLLWGGVGQSLLISQGGLGTTLSPVSRLQYVRGACFLRMSPGGPWPSRGWGLGGPSDDPRLGAVPIPRPLVGPMRVFGRLPQVSGAAEVGQTNRLILVAR